MTVSGRRRFLKTGAAASLGLALEETASGALRSERPSLPQHDSDLDSRRLQLERTRGLYTYDHGRIPSLPMVEKVPRADQFSLPWLRQAFQRAAELLENFVSRSPEASPIRALEALVRGALPGERPQGLEGYDALFRTIERPSIAETFHEDRVFARHRVAGPNPLVLHRIDALDDRFPLEGAVLEAVLPGDHLEVAGAEGRLYLADYRQLDGVQEGLFRGAPKFVSAPLAFFAVVRDSRELVPVAIQCEQLPGSDNPIFTPFDGHAWTMAKTVVQIADANLHEAVSHLGRTHLFVEPFVIATERQLAEHHPLRLLLRPHFEGTLAINEFAYSRLLRPGGFVDDLLAGTLEASTALAVEGVRSLPFEAAMLPRALAARGVDDPDLLPDYPYRDDALLYWKAIHDWVEDYLRLYYRSPSDLRDDFELAAWARELAAQDGGRVVGLESSRILESLDELVDAVTLVVFTSSVQHAAVNFPQLDLMTYAPNMPLAGFAPAPAGTGAGAEDLLELLPPIAFAREQIVILYFLGSVHHTTLGEYSQRQLYDRRLRRPLARFQSELDRVGRIVGERNRTRAPYRFLERAGIPQSINV